MLNKQEIVSHQNDETKKDLFTGKVAIIKNLLLIIIFIASISYLLCINDISIKGFVIKDLKGQIQKIADDNQSLEIKIAELKSLDKVYDRAQELKMVKVDKIDYLTISDTSVARK